MFLLEGEGVTGDPLYENDDAEGLNPRISGMLEPGIYTIEATTYEEDVTRIFLAWSSCRFDLPELCANGVAVADAESNKSLVVDCALLLDSAYILDAEPALNWSADVPMEEWEGVTHSESPMQVTELSLENRGLTGRIPDELDNLSGLERLSLTGNKLTGSIPYLLNLDELRVLELGSNRLKGEIPLSLGGPENLEVLYLHKNKLSGEIPPEIGYFENLPQSS